MKKLKLDELGRLDSDSFKSAPKNSIVVVLDNMRSMHNVGSIFRTCDAFAIEAIYLCGVTATPPNREIYKTALGAEETVQWEYFKTTQEAVSKLLQHNSIVLAIEQTNQSVLLDAYSFDPNKHYAFIFGNEVEGVQEEVLSMCHAAVEIPQFGTKHSFNVSISAGIVLWEAVKQLSHTPQ